jgi:hypothetical protein
MSEQPGERTPASLLLGAVDALPPADRNRVLVWLLEGGHRPHAGWPISIFRQALGGLPELPTLEPDPLMGRFATLRGEHQTVPVRLPTDQYHRLRDWCQEQGFSMATVIRGLVARFLDERGTPPAAKPVEP